ncbi:hypothetical protein NSK_007451 [Nannochloropsis salina CCMP1776]|uniref:Uncharacterized protein n=1 Tax=Nannochloropsis salina CCMP1776 TaxID=1027361 RepID=A0A4D9CRQ6_9STRA|nr:hypothetical protein NSK_007451 [Nannochloropsis salina CCMP1776]|eukprot:TFJ81234.1 hypothetical protein NSK_007451 [Nannochloropsis salina CCMP1776]
MPDGAAGSLAGQNAASLCSLPRRRRTLFPSLPHCVYLALTIVSFCSHTSHAEVIRLDAGNFELAVQTYQNLAILFHDEGGRKGGKEEGRGALTSKWEQVSAKAGGREE